MFSWIEGIAQNVSYELIVPYLSFMLKPLVREKADNETGNWSRSKNIKEEEEELAGRMRDSRKRRRKH